MLLLKYKFILILEFVICSHLGCLLPYAPGTGRVDR
jgi:hypothetical protein